MAPQSSVTVPLAWSEAVCANECANKFCKIQLQNAFGFPRNRLQHGSTFVVGTRIPTVRETIEATPTYEQKNGGHLNRGVESRSWLHVQTQCLTAGGVKKAYRGALSASMQLHPVRLGGYQGPGDVYFYKVHGRVRRGYEKRLGTLFLRVLSWKSSGNPSLNNKGADF